MRDLGVRRGGSRHERDLLLLLVRADVDQRRVAALFDVADVEAVVDLAEIHRVEGLVHDRLTTNEREIPVATHVRLNDLRMAAVERELLAHRAVTRLAALLEVPFLVVKGPVLASQCYDGPGLRSFSDVDVYVRRRDFVTALEMLTGGGFTELASNWDGFLAHEVAEVPLADGPVIVDLHWHPIAMGAHRRDIHLDEGALFNRAQQLKVGATDVATFGPEDTLLHLCVNNGLGGARRLLQLVDVDRVVRRHRIDWDVLVSRARDAGSHALCCGVLQRTRTLLDTPIDPCILGKLEPFPGWRSVNRLVDRRRRPRRLRQGIASGLLLAAGRATVGRTMAVGLRTTADAVLVRAGRPLPTGPGGALDWRRSGGAARDAEDRRRYLTWVSAMTDASTG